ncbi:MAG: S8 family serine peptidase [Bdellovibrionaceae bacterium]|nr:S8 family serine peptidase [Pseudobdellovibrionaceae bacterium]
MSKKPILRFALAVLCIFGSFTVWGVLGTALRKEPASVPQTGTTLRPQKDRDVILNEATAVSKKVKDGKEQNVLLYDPFIGEKWGLVRTNSHKAWEVSQGSKDIVVAVIDTGTDIRHKCLQDNLWVNKGEVGLDSKGRDKSTNGVDDDSNGYVDDVHGWNFVANSNDLTDNHGHGTHIAGIVGARSKADCAVSGVAPKVSIMTLKYYDPKSPGANNLKNTIQSIHYAIKMGARIINYSGGGTEYSAEEQAAVKEAEKKGILFIAAAGNERSNTDEPGKQYYPADYGLSNIISVTAVNEKETKVLPSSNYGVRTVDLAAPGDMINSTLPGNTFGKMTGTSQATAFVTGVAVLVMALRPEFSTGDVKKYILRTGDEYPTLLSKTGSAKLLNSYKALTNLDKGVSANGVTTANTERTRAFTSGSAAKEISPSALSTSSDRDPAEEIGTFGRDLINAIGGPTARERGAGAGAASRVPSRDPNIGE